MEKTIRTQFVKEFLEAVLTLESVDECMDFFEDVCTVKEVQSIAQRFTRLIVAVEAPVSFATSA